MRESRLYCVRMGTSRRRHLRWLVATIVVVGVFAGGWVAARQFQSPAQREAAARPPTPGPLFVPIKDGVLSDRVSGSGSITYERIDTVAVTRGGVVTGRTLTVGRMVGAGGVLTEIESHPVFVFVGKFPFYRDLVRGDQGADVAQLQSGLRAAGHPIPQSETGTFGAGTVNAVKALYSAAHYSAPAGFPVADLSVASSLPATVDAVPAIGSNLADGAALATLAQGQLVARVTLGAGAFTSVRAGQQTEVTGDGIGTPLSGRVARLAAGDSHSDPQVTVAFATRPRPDLAGRPVVATITIEAVAHIGLIVPTRAIADGTGGTAAVIVKVAAGRQSMEVRVLGSLDGRSVIEAADPSAAGMLKPGALVQVG